MPRHIVGEDGMARAVGFERTFERDGRLCGTGQTFELPADMVFKAVGQRFHAEGLGGMALNQGRIAVDAERRTSLERVWAGGDCVAGGQDLTVAAVEDGKRAAESIHLALMR
jgi:dihydropyrimidine dehydrogenase (NAD+) subunit PreT